MLRDGEEWRWEHSRKRRGGALKGDIRTEEGVLILKGKEGNGMEWKRNLRGMEKK